MRYLFTIAILSLGLAILPVSPVAAITTTPTPSIASDVMEATITPSTPSTSSARFPGVEEYVLPYPGILPTHPLYKVKELRDKIIDLLIVDPVRKSEFYVLQADKWLAASDLLLDSDSIDLSNKLLVDSTTRLEDATSQLEHLKSQSRPYPGSAKDRVKRSVEKHIVVVEQRSQSEVTAEVLTSLQTIYERVNAL